MKKKVKLSTGKVVNITILVQDDGFTTIKTDIDVTEDEAEEIVCMNF